VVDCGAKAKLVDGAGGGGRRVERREVPDRADVVAQVWIPGHFIECCRDGHGDRVGRRLCRPSLRAAEVIGIFAESPDAIELERDALGVGLRV